MTTFSITFPLLALFFPNILLTTALAYIRCVLTKPLPINSLELTE